MVKRKAYEATVTLEIAGGVVNGEWQEGRTDTLSIKGHYKSATGARIIIRRNANGDEKQVSGFFFPGKKPKFEGGPIRLSVPVLEIDVPIICWDSYQSHSVINV